MTETTPEFFISLLEKLKQEKNYRAVCLIEDYTTSSEYVSGLSILDSWKHLNNWTNQSIKYGVLGVWDLIALNPILPAYINVGVNLKLIRGSSTVEILNTLIDRYKEDGYWHLCYLVCKVCADDEFDLDASPADGWNHLENFINSNDLFGGYDRGALITLKADFLESITQ